MTTLTQAVAILNAAAPLALAEPWDNVGLLLEPIPSADVAVKRVVLAIDASRPVVDEVLELGAELLVAYHPPIFSGLKRWTQADPREADLLRLARAGVAIYSPHTALDSVPGGVNDWLASAFRGQRSVLLPNLDVANAGQGRSIELKTPRPIDDIVDRIRTHLGLTAVRVAKAQRHAEGSHVTSIGLCPGAGGDVLRDARCDVLWTGEMRHHDVLAATASGRSVILCEHTNTERGFLVPWAQELRDALPGVAIHVSDRDCDPLAWDSDDERV